MAVMRRYLPIAMCLPIALVGVLAPRAGAVRARPHAARPAHRHAPARKAHRHAPTRPHRGRPAPARPKRPSAPARSQALPHAWLAPPPSPGSSAPASTLPAASAPAASDGSPQLVWSDEFDGPQGASPDTAKWSFDTGGNGWGNDELQSYTARPSNAALDGHGDLVVTARAEHYVGEDGVAREYTSARLQTLDTFRFRYGRMEARIRVPAGDGLLPAFWALGDDAYSSDDAWPACGEIDAMEVLGSEPDLLHGTLHGPWSWAPGGIERVRRAAAPLSDGFHTYGVDWAPGDIRFLLDGAVYATVDRTALPAGAAWPFEHPAFLLLDLAVGGDWPGAPTAATPLPAQMLVDWVRVWR
jgi:beta-glucanase (GH16 family)